MKLDFLQIVFLARFDITYGIAESYVLIDTFWRDIKNIQNSATLPVYNFLQKSSHIFQVAYIKDVINQRRMEGLSKIDVFRRGEGEFWIIDVYKSQCNVKFWISFFIKKIQKNVSLIFVRERGAGELSTIVKGEGGRGSKISKNWWRLLWMVPYAVSIIAFTSLWKTVLQEMRNCIFKEKRSKLELELFIYRTIFCERLNLLQQETFKSMEATK